MEERKLSKVIWETHSENSAEVIGEPACLWYVIMGDKRYPSQSPFEPMFNHHIVAHDAAEAVAIATEEMRIMFPETHRYHDVLKVKRMGSSVLVSINADFN